MKTKIANLWQSIFEMADSWDHDVDLVWRSGAESEQQADEMVAAGLSPFGHGKVPQPEWLRRQQHFEHVVESVVVHIWGEIAPWVCAVFGHRIEIDEEGSGPDRPCVDYWCSRCYGVQGRSWF